MELNNLEHVLESILFVAGTAVAVKDIADKLELQNSEINAAVEKLQKKYSGKSGICLLKFNGKLQFASNSAYADPVAAVLNPIKEKELSKACLETIAIVAYKQPVTRLEVEEVRGVSSDYALQVLERHKLVEVIGRKDAIGKPLLFGTTEDFLKRFQLENLDELPDYEQLLDRLVKIEGPKEASSLYNHFDVPVDEQGEDTPDFLQGEEIVKVEG